MKSMVFALAFGITSLCAQTTVGVLGGISYRDNDYTRYDFNYSPVSWNNGVTLGLQTDYSFTQSIALRAVIEYSHYSFDKFRYVGAAPPEFRLGPSHGNDSHCYRAMLEGVYAIRISRYFAPIIMTGVGYAEERNGDVWFTLIDDLNGTQIESRNPSRFKAFLFHSIGVGIQSYLAPFLGIELSAKNLTNYADRSHQSLGLALIIGLD